MHQDQSVLFPATSKCQGSLALVQVEASDFEHVKLISFVFLLKNHEQPALAYYFTTAISSDI